MNLYLLRHGIAVDPGTPGFARDADRPLTAEGKRKLRRVAAAIAAMNLSFDLILSSPLVRAKQTAEIIAAGRAPNPLELCPHLAPAGDFRELVRLLNRREPRPEEVLLVGHEPYLSELIALLVSRRGASVVMKKGGLGKVAVTTLKAGYCGALEWLLTPKQMAFMGKSRWD